MANTSALVTKLEGQAWIRNADGSLQPLRVGMRVPVDAEIITAAGSQLALQGNEAGSLQIAEGQQLKLTDDLFQTPDAGEAAITNLADADVNALITALNQGQDPLAELDPTAAILAGGDGAGSTYVRLANVIENTTPLALEYPRSIGGTTQDFISGGAIAAEDEEPAPQAGVVSDAQSVYETGLGNAATTETTTGNIAVSASDGISSITIGGVTFTLTQLQGDVTLLPVVDTGKGILKITGYIPGVNDQAGTVSYEYTLSEAQTHDQALGQDTQVTDIIDVVVTGVGGSTGSGNVTITIEDDAPQAEDDAFAQQAENTSVTINALGNDTQGADGVNLVTDVTHTQPQNGGTAATGTLVYNEDGTFTYQPGDGEEGTVTFDYTITDADGDSSTAAVTITLVADSEPTVNIVRAEGDSGQVLESGLVGGSAEGTGTTTSGTLSISLGNDTLGTVKINGVDVTAGGTVTGAHGSLVVTVANGVYSYIYTLTGTATDVDNVAETDDFTVVVTDSDGSTANAALTIEIVDDVPVAVNDTASQTTENAAVIVNALGNDTKGADGVNAATGVALVAGSLNAEAKGSVVYNGDGTFTYTPAAGEEGVVTFDYTITDADGDISTATVIINLVADSVPTVNITRAEGDDGIVWESALSGGSGGGDTSASGSITVNTGGDTLETLEVQDKDGNWVTINLVAGSTTSVAGQHGSLVVNADKSWIYTLNEASEHNKTAGQDTQKNESFAVRATDSDSDVSASASIG
ncbi:retention module-containing protein, partial [Comamonas jiangduensis]|uniref:retention module-containing protein n=1 Tax=Comamonas jiangduensis TaxID=1194168 RepID=UPI003BF8F9EB